MCSALPRQAGFCEKPTEFCNRHQVVAFYVSRQTKFAVNPVGFGALVHGVWCLKTPPVPAKRFTFQLDARSPAPTPSAHRPIRMGHYSDSVGRHRAVPSTVRQRNEFIIVARWQFKPAMRPVTGPPRLFGRIDAFLAGSHEVPPNMA